MKRAILDYINDILDGMIKAQEFVQGMSYKEFLQEVKTQFAVVRAKVIWRTVKEDIPAVKPLFERLREDYIYEYKQ